MIFSDWLKVWLAAILLFYALSIYMALACSDKDVKNAICWASCRADNFDGGHYRGRKCVCEALRDFQDAPRGPIDIYPVAGGEEKSPSLEWVFRASD